MTLTSGFFTSESEYATTYMLLGVGVAATGGIIAFLKNGRLRILGIIILIAGIILLVNGLLAGFGDAFL